MNTAWCIFGLSQRQAWYRDEHRENLAPAPLCQSRTGFHLIHRLSSPVRVSGWGANDWTGRIAVLRRNLSGLNNALIPESYSRPQNATFQREGIDPLAADLHSLNDDDDGHIRRLMAASALDVSYKSSTWFRSPFLKSSVRLVGHLQSTVGDYGVPLEKAPASRSSRLDWHQK